MVVHVTAGVRGPCGPPKRAHGRQDFPFGAKTKITFELAGKVGALAVLDQRRGPHDTQRRLLTLLAPGGEKRRKNFRRDRALIKRKPDLDRDAARGREISFVILPQQVLDAEMLHLLPVGIRGERESARCWQARPHQAGEIRCLGSDPLGVGGRRIIEGQDEGGHCSLSVTEVRAKRAAKGGSPGWLVILRGPPSAAFSG